MSGLDKVLGSTNEVSQFTTSYVNFTNQLVAGVIDTLVQSGIDQMMAYSELVNAISQTVDDYAAEMTGLDLSAINAAGNKSILDSYITDVLGLEISGSADVDLTGDIQSTTEHFKGITKDDGGTLKTFKEVVGNDNKIAQNDLRLFVFKKLKEAAETNYNVLVALVREGWIKILPNDWLIQTDLQIHLSSEDISRAANFEYNRRASGWSIGGSVSGSFKAWGFRIAGGYSNSKLNVSTRSASTSSKVTSDVIFKGHVRIQGTADTYEPNPSVGS